MKKLFGRETVGLFMGVLVLLLLLINAFPVVAAEAKLVTLSPDIKECDASKNLISDNSFEECATDGSNHAFLNTSNDFKYWGSVGAAGAHNGSKGVILPGKDWGSWSGPYLKPTITNLEENTEYTFSFWYKIAGTTSSPETCYKYFVGSNVLGGDQFPIIDGEWHQAGITFNTGDQTSFSFYFIVSNAELTLYVDDLYLFKTSDVEPTDSTEDDTEPTAPTGDDAEPTDPTGDDDTEPTEPPAGDKLPTIDTSHPENMNCAPSANLFNDANWNFEQGDAFWRWVNKIDGLGTMYNYVARVTEENPHEGKKSLQIDGVGGWSNLYIPIFVKKNTRYTFSMWVCATPGSDGKANTIFKWAAVEGTDPTAYTKKGKYVYFSPDLKIAPAYDGKWYQVGCTIETNDFEQILLYIGDGGGKIFIDEIRFFETDEPNGTADTKLARLDAIKDAEADEAAGNDDEDKDEDDKDVKDENKDDNNGKNPKTGDKFAVTQFVIALVAAGISISVYLKKRSVNIFYNMKFQ